MQHAGGGGSCFKKTSLYSLSVSSQLKNSCGNPVKRNRKASIQKYEWNHTWGKGFPSPTLWFKWGRSLNQSVPRDNQGTVGDKALNWPSGSESVGELNMELNNWMLLEYLK